MFMCARGVRFAFFFSSRRRHTRCALVTGVQTCALPILKLPQTLSPSEVLAWFGDRQAITGTGALRHVAALWDSGQQERAREAARQYWVDADFDSREESAFHRHFQSLLRDEDELARLARLLWDPRAAAPRRPPTGRPTGRERR